MPFYFLDTERVYKNAIVTIARRFGKTYTNEIAAKVTGTIEPESARIAVTEMKLPIPVEDFRNEFRTTSHLIFAKYGAPIMPGTISIEVRYYVCKILPILLFSNLPFPS